MSTGKEVSTAQGRTATVRSGSKARLAVEYEQAVSLFSQAASSLSLKVDKDLRRGSGGTSLTEFNVLRALNKAKGERLHMTALARATSMNRFAMSRLVDKMANSKKYVTWYYDSDDGRATWVAITAQGNEAFNKILQPVYEDAIQTHFAHLLNRSAAKSLGDLFFTLIQTEEK